MRRCHVRPQHVGQPKRQRLATLPDATPVKPLGARIMRRLHWENGMKWVRSGALALLAVISMPTWAVDADERRFIRKGMKEGEVVLRIGKPDHETFIRNIKGEPEEKAWTYFPDPRDPQTLTILTIKAGIVELVERKVSR